MFRKQRIRMLAVSMLVLLLGGCGAGDGPNGPQVGGVEPGEMLRGWIAVDFEDGTTKADFDEWESAWGIDLEFNSHVGPRSGLTLAEVEGDLQSLLQRIREHPRVESAEPLYEYRSLWTPNDPKWRYQWNMRKVGGPASWNRATGRGVVVAVIDTGIAYTDHERFRQVEDLEGARFAPGWDFVNNDDTPLDDHGHGTHVAGTISQSTGNGIGVAGLAHEATLMPLKVLSASGMGHSADIADAIRFAADNGAHVINLSLGGRARSEVIARAVEHARRMGVVIVAAAGNGGRRGVSYPAAFPGVIAVSATRFDDALAPYSSFGAEVSIAAPGGDKSVDQSGDGTPDGILQNTIDPGRPGSGIYASFQGTSMAAPHVAGAAALLISMGVTRPEEVERVLFETARKAPGQWARNERHGHGVLDAGAAVSVVWKRMVAGRAAFTAALLAALLLLMRRRLPPAIPGPGLLIPLLLCSLGVFFLPWVLPRFPGREILSLPLMEWGLLLFGPKAHANPLTWSVLPALAAAFFLHPARGLRPILAGLALGSSAFLMHAAVAGGAAIYLLPGLWGTGWLLINAVVAFVLAFALSRKEARR